MKRDRLINELKNNFTDWGMVCSQGDIYYGWKWNGVCFTNNDGVVVSEYDVFPKPKKCKIRNEFADFLKTFDDWDHVKRFVKDPINNHWGWEWCGDYVRKHGYGVITERDVFPEDWVKDLSRKPVCTGIVKQFKPVYSSETIISVSQSLVYEDSVI